MTTTRPVRGRLKKALAGVFSLLLLFTLLPAGGIFADEAGKVSVTITVRTEEPVGGAGGREGCSAICPPNMPLLQADKTDELVEGTEGNGMVDPGDTLAYRVEINRVEPSGFQELVYVEPISPHLQFIEGSLSSSFGAATLKRVKGEEVVHVVFSTEEGEGDELEFPLEITYKVRVDPQLPDGVESVSGQGILYSGNSPTAVTEDPETVRLEDPTRTPIGDGTGEAGGAGGVEESRRQVWVEKDVLEIKGGPEEVSTVEQPEEEVAEDRVRVIRPGSRISFEIIVGNDSEEPVEKLQLMDPIDHHLELEPDSLTLDGEPLEPRQLDETGVLSVVIPRLDPDETTKITYRVQAREGLNPDLGYLGTNVRLVGENVSSRFSDDPETELFPDRTALLLPDYCSEENYLQKWDLWFDRVANAEPSLVPLILTPPAGQASGREEVSGPAGGAGETNQPGEEPETEEEEQEELTWTLFGSEEGGEERSGTLQVGAGGQVSGEEELESPYRLLPRHSLFGTGKLSYEVGTEEISLRLDIDPEVAGGAGMDEEPGGGVYVQCSSDGPVFKRLSTDGLKVSELTGTGGSGLCGEQYLLYVMDSSLRRELSSREDDDSDDLLQLFRYDEVT